MPAGYQGNVVWMHMVHKRCRLDLKSESIKGPRRLHPISRILLTTAYTIIFFSVSSFPHRVSWKVSHLKPEPSYE